MKVSKEGIKGLQRLMMPIDIITLFIKINRLREAEGAFQANRSSGRKLCHSDRR